MKRFGYELLQGSDLAFAFDFNTVNPNNLFICYISDKIEYEEISEEIIYKKTILKFSRFRSKLTRFLGFMVFKEYPGEDARSQIVKVDEHLKSKAELLKYVEKSYKNRLEGYLYKFFFFENY